MAKIEVNHTLCGGFIIVTLNIIRGLAIPDLYDLIDGFYRYLSEPIWFDFLLARMEIVQNPEKGADYLGRVIKKVNKLELAEEMLIYLAQERLRPLFCQLALKTLSLLESEEEFKEFLDLCALHFENNAFNTLIEQRKDVAFDTPFEKDDPDVKMVKKLINQKLPIGQ